MSEYPDELGLVAEILRGVDPPPDLRQRLLDRIRQYETLKPLADVRSCDGSWSASGVPGVEIRNLFLDPETGRNTTLVRMAAGARFPAHRHNDSEQCLVLNGDIGWGELIYNEGDFVVMGKSTTHPEIRSVNGSLLLIVAGHNEFVSA